MKLTKKQFIWLDSRGGRTINDVNRDKSGTYVLMSDGVGGK